VIRPFFTRSTVIPVKRIFLLEPSGREPTGRSLKALPVRATAFPLPDYMVALGDQIGSAPEIQIREGGAKLGGEFLHGLAAAEGRMHRVFEADVRAAISSMTAGFHGFPQNSVNQRPTIALFFSDMTVSFREVTNLSALVHPVDAAASENVRWNSLAEIRWRHCRIASAWSG
jgi:hypothetical protein